MSRSSALRLARADFQRQTEAGVPRYGTLETKPKATRRPRQAARQPQAVVPRPISNPDERRIALLFSRVTQSLMRSYSRYWHGRVTQKHGKVQWKTPVAPGTRTIRDALSQLKRVVTSKGLTELRMSLHKEEFSKTRKIARSDPLKPNF